MDNTELKYYELWKRIEKKTFIPEDKRDRTKTQKWLQQLLRFFQPLYELESQFPKLDVESGKYVFDNFSMTHLNCTFRINMDLSGFSFCLKCGQTSLLFEYDSNYLCEWKYFEELAPSNKITKKNKYKKEEKFGIEKSDLEHILKHMIAHPAIHCHIDSEILKEIFPKTDLHEIRIGMPTTNPFLFLYQVSFQFLSLIDEQKKEAELKRLAGVIWENRDNMSISPGLLFSLSTNRSKPDQKKV